MSSATPGGINPSALTPEENRMNWQRLCAFLASKGLNDDGSLIVGITDIGLSAPSLAFFFGVGNSPLTTEGTITLTAGTQSAHTFMRGGTSGSTTPVFGLIIPADLATGGTAGLLLSIDTNGHFTWTAGGTSSGVTSVGLAGPTDSVAITVSPVTTTGTLTWAWSTQSAHTFHAGPYSGSPAAPTWRSILTNDLATGGSVAQVLTIANSSGAMTWTTPSAGGTSSGWTHLTFTNPGGASALSRSGWTVTASVSGGGATSNAVDGNGGTRWSTGNAIVPNTDFFKIDTGASQTIGGFVIDDTSSSGDIPSSGDIKTSPDNITYTTQASWTSGDIVSGILSKAWTPLTTRYVKLVATATANGGSGNWWSIEEINLYDTGTPAADSNVAAAETITGNSTQTVTITAVIKRDTPGRGFGLRVGADSSNWFGVLWTSATLKCQKSVAGVITDLGTTASTDNDVIPHRLTLSISMGNTTGQCWLVSELSKAGGGPWTVSVADGSIDLSTGILKIFSFTDLPADRLRSPSYILQ